MPVGGVVFDNTRVYPGDLTSYAVVTCAVVAMGGLIFCYDIGISVMSMPSLMQVFFPSMHRNQQENTSTNEYYQYDNETFTMFMSSLYMATLVAFLVASMITRQFGRMLSMLFGGVGSLFKTKKRHDFF